MPSCIFCRKDLIDESPEHIILNSFGGRRTTTQVVCTNCNLRLGNEIDKLFSNDFAIFLNMANIYSGAGEPPPTVRNVTLKDGTKVDFLQGFKPQYKRVVYLRQRDGQKLHIRIGVPTLQRLASQLDNFAKGVGFTKEKFLEHLRTVSASSERNYLREMIPFNIGFGLQHQERSVLKAAIVLWALHSSNAEVLSSPFDRTRDYVLNGVDADQLKPDPWIAHFNFGSFPVKRIQGFDISDFSHSLAVWSDHTGRVVAYYQFLGYFGFSLRIAPSNGSPNIGVLLQQNPLTGQSQILKLSPEMLPDCSVIEELHDSSQECKAAVSNLLDCIYQKLGAGELNDIVQESMKRTLPSTGHIIEEHHLGNLSSEVAEAFANALFRMD